MIKTLQQSPINRNRNRNRNCAHETEKVTVIDTIVAHRPLRKHTSSETKEFFEAVLVMFADNHANTP